MFIKTAFALLLASVPILVSALDLIIRSVDDPWYEPGVNCGEIQWIVIEKDIVNIKTNGTCLDSGNQSTPIVIKDVMGGAVVAGTTLSIDPSYGATVTAPNKITVEIIAPLPSLPGASVVVLAPDNVVYTAPAPGSVSTTTTDTFGYKLTDGTGNFDTGIVTVTVIP